jgi:hypothetical protein
VRLDYGVCRKTDTENALAAFFDIAHGPRHAELFVISNYWRIVAALEVRAVARDARGAATTAKKSVTCTP